MDPNHCDRVAGCDPDMEIWKSRPTHVNDMKNELFAIMYVDAGFTLLTECI
jgi:hypothetical protein